MRFWPRIAGNGIQEKILEIPTSLAIGSKKKLLDWGRAKHSDQELKGHDNGATRIHAHATFALNNGLFEYAKAVAKSLEISCGRNSDCIVVYREHTGRGAGILGTRGNCQGSSSAGQG
jgi:hypothetical protein